MIKVIDPGHVPTLRPCGLQRAWEFKEVNPRYRTDWPLAFQEFRAMIDAIPEAHRTEHDAICDGCGSRLFLVRGRHSGLFFYSHEGIHGCTGTRAIFFTDKQAAMESERVFR